VETKQPQGSRNNSVTIIFDGRAGYGDCQYSSQLKVLFSKGETADAVIKRIVEKAKNKKRIVVVSNDRGIRSVVSALGANVMRVKDFLNAKAAAARGRASRKTKADEINDPKNISKTVEYQINREFEEIWIKRKGKR
jgi:predicted RNA-binding protein with PIN domain